MRSIPLDDMLPVYIGNGWLCAKEALIYYFRFGRKAAVLSRGFCPIPRALVQIRKLPDFSESFAVEETLSFLQNIQGGEATDLLPCLLPVDREALDFVLQNEEKLSGGYLVCRTVYAGKTAVPFDY